MKRKSLVLLLVALLSFYHNTYAAFPVKNVDAITENAPTSATTVNTDTKVSGKQRVASFLNNIAHTDRHRKYSSANETNAILSFVFGILGLFFILFGIPALILGIRASDRRNKNHGLATAGLIMGAIETGLLALGLVILIIVLIALAV